MILNISKKQRYFYNWYNKHKIDFWVTLAITIDWLPTFLSGNEDTMFSGTKLLVVPLILIDILKSKEKYVFDKYGILFLLAVLIGLGGGVIFGDVTLARLISILVSYLVLVFFVKKRRAIDIYYILKIITYVSVMVPIVIILGYYGLIQPLRIITLENIIRIQGGTNWSSFGFYVSVSAASFGGLMLSKESKYDFIKGIFVAVYIIIWILGIVFAGQRTAAIIFLFTAISSILYYIKKPNKYKLKSILGFSIFIFAFISYIGINYIQEITYTIDYRLSQLNMNYDFAESGKIREQQYVKFLHDITNDHNVIGEGTEKFLESLGNIPHFILGEAYYDGGLILFVVLLFMLIKSSTNLIKSYKHILNPFFKDLNYVLIIIFIGFIINISFYAALNIRIFVLFLGLWLSPIFRYKSKQFLKWQKNFVSSGS